MHAAAQAAVGRGDHPLAADQPGEAADALGDQLGMLDHIGGMADHTGQDQPVVGQPGVAPDAPFVLVAHIAGLEGVRPGVDLEHHLDDVAHGDVGGVRAVPAAPAEMKADAILRQAAQRVVERFDPRHGELAVFFGRRLGIDLIEVLGDRRIVDLQDETSLDDRLVLLAHRLGTGEDEFLVALVVLVADARGAARPDRGHESLGDIVGGKGRLEVGDVGSDGGVAGVAERRHADRPVGGARPGGDAGIAIAIGLGKAQPVAPVAEARQHHVAGARSPHRKIIEAEPGHLEPAQPREGIAPPGAVVDLGAHRLAVLAVARHGDAGGHLAAHDVAHGRRERFLERRLVDLASLALMVGLDKVVRPRQAAGVAGEDAIAAASHVSAP